MPGAPWETPAPWNPVMVKRPCPKTEPLMVRNGEADQAWAALILRASRDLRRAALFL